MMNRKKIKIQLTVLPVILFLSIISINAAGTWSNSITLTNLPTYGNVKYSYVGNKKQDNGLTASFTASKVSAALPTFGCIRDENDALRSEWTYLVQGSAVYHAKEYDALKGQTYYSSVKTSNYEFGSNNSVTYKFSSDYKTY